MRFVIGDHALDTVTRELRRGEELVEMEPQVFDLLLYLVENRDRVVSKDDLISTVWQGRIVSDSTLTSRIATVRQAIGDTGRRQQFIRTISRRGIRFVGEVRQLTDADIHPPARPSGVLQAATAAGAAHRQDVRFCRTADGVNLAVATSGDGPPLVKTANWLNHIEFDWQSPIWSPLLARLHARSQLIRYDERGTGLSDWNVADISFESFVHDLATVVDALELKRFALLGISQGAAVAVAYATRHPDRVSCLVLSGGYAEGWRKRGTAEQLNQRQTLATLVRAGWGQENPAFRQVFTSLFIPDATLEEMRWFNDLQRVSTSPENAVRLIDVFGNIAIADLLPRVAVPTLVLHSREDALVPLEQGLKLARGIPGARFVALDSRNHLLLEHEAAWQRFVAEVSDFLSAHEDSGAESRSSLDMPDRMSKTLGLMRKSLPRSQRRRGKRVR
jgi:DNA-binding winged helix-turn-helix (wHTH) protein/pimeloyl-ACP methyl ester carboxylesterase